MSIEQKWSVIAKDEVVITEHLSGSEDYQFISTTNTERTVGYLRFQEGNPADGVNGVTFESILEVLAERIGRFQESEFACAENEQALTKIKEARDILYSRIQRRKEEGVLGTQEPESQPFPKDPSSESVEEESTVETVDEKDLATKPVESKDV